MSTESYKHQFAKQTLIGWLRGLAADCEKECGSFNEWVSLRPIEWRVNRRAPHYGVWAEYPVCLNRKNQLAGFDPCWDEQCDIPDEWMENDEARRIALKEYEATHQDPSGHDWTFGSTDAGWLAVHNSFPNLDHLITDPWDLAPPTYQQCLEMGYVPICIFDVAIQHKGNILIAFEVVHRNPINEIKKGYLRRIQQEFCLSVYAIEADWILSQVGRPARLVCEDVFERA